MIEVYGLNPFAEAMLYYLGKANDFGVRKRLDKAVSQHPECKKELEKAAKPAKALERRLDARLTVDDTLVKKFFKNFEGIEPFSPFGFCLASVMALNPLTNNMKRPVDKLVKQLRECSAEEQVFSFCSSIADKNELILDAANGTDEFLRRIEKLQISSEDKLKVMTAAFAYQKNMDELLSLIMPAAELIEAAFDECDDIINEFRIRYSGDNARKLINACFVDKLPYFENLDVIPSILGFNAHLATFDDTSINIENGEHSNAQKDNAEKNISHSGNVFLGVGRHFIGSAAKNEIPALCDKVKALSDATRLEMLFYLCSHKPYAQELGIKFGLGHSAVSYHMTRLSAAGFVIAELSGGKTYYSADKGNIKRMLDAFSARIK